MAVSEFQRQQIFQWCEEHMDPERAAIMMELLPPVGWGDLATKTELRAELKDLRADLKLVAVEIKQSVYLAMLASNATIAALVLAAVKYG